MSSTPSLFDAFPPVGTEAWIKRIAEDLRGADPETLRWHDFDGLAVRPFYRAEDLDGLSHKTPIFRRERPVVVRQDLTASDLGAANQLAHEAVASGVAALGLISRVEADHLLGLPLLRAEDMAQLLDGVPLDRISFHLDAGIASPAVLAMWLQEAERRETGYDTLAGSLIYDPLALLAARDSFDVDGAFDVLGGLLADHRLPAAFRRVNIDVRPYHEAGATSAQSLTYAIGALAETMDQCISRGLTAQQIADQVQFIVPVGTSFFIEIARLRALRLLAAQVFEAFKVEARPQVQAVTDARSMTIYDPHVNMLRNTTRAAAAILGGCDVVTVVPHDGAYASENAFADRMARNTAHILQHEAHLHAVDDPAAGSYYIETLTDLLARRAWEHFQEIEAAGGMRAALTRGIVQETIAATQTRRADAFAHRKNVLVGTNQYPNPDETRRDDIKVSDALALAASSRTWTLDPDKTLETLQDALREGATLADLVAALPSDNGITVAPLLPKRDAEPFEELRVATEQFAALTGHQPTVFLLAFGHPAWRTARATFARNFFGCAGFAIEEPGAFEWPEAGAQAAAKSDAEIVVLCSADDAYEAAAPVVAQQFDEAASPPVLVVAGDPKKLPEATLREAGVDDFIYLGTPLLDTLRQYHEQLGLAAHA